VQLVGEKFVYVCAKFLSAKKIEIIVLFHAVYHFNNLFASVLTECSIITGNISLKK